jgi:hypothetical protein
MRRAVVVLGVDGCVLGMQVRTHRRRRAEGQSSAELKTQILGVEREGDLPGELIPYVYFEFLRTREAFKPMPIFHHNAIDILTLACLTGIVPWAFHSPQEAQLSHGAEMFGLGRWLRRAEQFENALTLFRRAVERGLPDDLLFRTPWDIASLEKKAGARRPRSKYSPILPHRATLSAQPRT